ncbi:MAG TPA: hypothetical protein VHD86_04765 [Xanthobacteraceae bacterium]|nr:hypothetical protein [Xanthobacteraceae bacterium]
MPFGKATGCATAVRRAAATAALLATAFTALPIASLSAQTPEREQALAQQAIQRLDLQTDLLRQPEPFQFQINLPPETLWVIVILGACMLLYAFRDMIPMFRTSRGADWTGDEIGTGETGQPAAGMALGAADDLAAQGRFVEAMHVLLLQALAEIRVRLNEQFADSLTSREILRNKQLSDELRHPLRDVVNRVEWTYFGEHPAEQNDYLACRSSFTALARCLYGSAAA